MEDILKCIEARESVQRQSLSQQVVLKGKAEVNWTTRAVVVYFYYHPLLGRKDLALTSSIFGFNEKTVEGWIFKKEFRAKWYEIVTHFGFDDVVAALPKTASGLVSRLNNVDENLKKLPQLEIPLRRIFCTKNSDRLLSHQSIFCKADNGKYITTTAKRVYAVKSKDTLKFGEVQVL